MGNYYPGSGATQRAGRSERGASGGRTINLSPSEYRRIISNPPSAANDNAPRAANDNHKMHPDPVKAPGSGVARIPGAGIILGVGAFWAGIYLINKYQAAVPGQDAWNEFIVDLPGTSRWGNAQKWWCAGTIDFPPDLGPTRAGYTAGSGGTSCIGAQAVADSPPTDPIHRRAWWSALGQLPQRYTHIVTYNIGASAPGLPVGNPPQLVRHPATEPTPEIPARYGFDAGLGYPGPFRPAYRHGIQPRAPRVPWRRLNELEPYRPGEVGYHPTPRPGIDPSAPPGWWPNPAPNAPPNPLPGRPPPGTKERKVMMAIDPRSPMAKAISTITETGDFLDCLHENLRSGKAVKKVYNGKFVDPATNRKALAVLRNLDQIDIHGFIQCAVNNMIEDGIFGYAGQLSAKANRRTGRFAGFQVGPAL